MPSFAPPLRQLLLGLTLLGLLPLAALTAVSIYSAREAQHREVQRATLDLARGVASAIEAELAASIWALNALATSDAVTRDDFRTMHGELVRFAQARPDVVAISVADSQGHVILRSSDPIGTTVSQAIEPASLVKVLETASPHVGPMIKGPLGQFVYAVRVPVVKQGHVKYVLTAGIRPVRVRDILQRQNRPADWVIAVFDAEARRVARSRDNDASPGGPPSPSLAALLSSTRSAEGVGMTRALEGDGVVTAFVRLPTSHWVVAVGSPAALVDVMSGSTLILYVLGVGGSLLVSIALALFLSRRIRADIHHVIEQANNIGTDTEGPAYTPHTPELAVLVQHVGRADKRVREALEQAVRAGAAKDQFLAVLGHELRNPLAPISNVLAILDRKAGASTALERDILRRQVRHMTRLVDDLLDVSRLVEGKLTFRREPLDLGQLVSELAETFGQQAPQAQLDIQLPPGRLMVHADPTRLVQAITNLLVNAIRHGAGRPVRVEVAGRGAMAEVLVTDQGEGMTPETLAQVFEPFYQAQTNAGSLGLGLAIVKGIVERHGGAVHASSAGPGLGSTFVVALPAIAAPGAEPDGAAHGGEPMVES